MVKATAYGWLSDFAVLRRQLPVPSSQLPRLFPLPPAYQTSTIITSFVVWNEKAAVSHDGLSGRSQRRRPKFTERRRVPSDSRGLGHQSLSKAFPTLNRTRIRVAKKKKTEAGVDKNLDTLCYLAKEMQAQGPTAFPGPKDDSVTAFVMTQSMSSLSGDFEDVFREIVDGLSLVEHIKSRYTRAAVSNLCWNFLFRESDRVIDQESRKVGDDFDSRVKAAKVGLRKTLCDVPMTSWTVFLGVEGFGEIDSSGWEFGGVKFLPSRDANLFLAQKLDIVMRPAQRDNPKSIEFNDFVLKDHEKSGGKRTVAVVTITGMKYLPL